METPAGEIFLTEAFSKLRDLVVANMIPSVTVTEADTKVGTILSTIITQYTDGQKFLVFNTTANTGAATLNINGIGAKALEKDAGTALSSADMITGGYYLVSYNLSADKFLILNSL
jgi:hypothetical protein